jgi:hypothetical protein
VLQTVPSGGHFTQGPSVNPARTEAITIRPEYPADELALKRLAMLDSADTTPPRPLLIAEVDGELRVAMSLRDGSAIADPFHRTARTLALLQAYARRTTGSQRRQPSLNAVLAAARGMRAGRRTPAWAR